MSRVRSPALVWSAFSLTHTRTHAAQRNKNLFFSTDVDEAIRKADIIFVSVNTPTKIQGIGKGSAADLRFVERATRRIAEVATSNKIVVEKSTVPCKTGMEEGANVIAIV